MNREEFVKAVKAETSDAAVTGTISWLKKPAGRQPVAKKVELSKWFTTLSHEDRIRVEEIIRESAELAVFAFFSLLDGMAFVDGGEDKGSLELYYVRAEQRILLNDMNGECLHDIYKWYTTKPESSQ